LSSATSEHLSLETSPGCTGVSEAAGRRAGTNRARPNFYYGEMEMRRKAKAVRGKAKASLRAAKTGRVADRQLTTPWAERRILDLYWFFSGYALRAWRAFAALVLVLLVSSILISRIGFSAHAQTTTTVTASTPAGTVRLQTPAGSVDRSFGRAVLISLEGAVFRNPDPQLNLRGRAIQTLIRFLGPVLLGLTLLSIRGRVKR
jgi:hypothetical protein